MWRGRAGAGKEKTKQGILALDPQRGLPNRMKKKRDECGNEVSVSRERQFWVGSSGGTRKPKKAQVYVRQQGPYDRTEGEKKRKLVLKEGQHGRIHQRMTHPSKGVAAPKETLDTNTFTADILPKRKNASRAKTGRRRRGLNLPENQQGKPWLRGKQTQSRLWSKRPG